ncbi:hypothetical protein AGMMS50239_41180 [Bacteroidia bacterium]|nr:hypothetical protein AGMMS50239_41180 [Bacteroidia bacterium]
MTATQDKKTVSGTVVDEKGEAVIGASIGEKGTTNGTITNLEGRFSLNVSSDAVLQVSYIGYSTQEITVGNQSNLSSSSVFTPKGNFSFRVTSK